MIVFMFCVPGGHPGPRCGTDPAEKQEAPRDWRMVKASFNEATRVWYWDPDSPATIPVCPEHEVLGEPKNN